MRLQARLGPDAHHRRRADAGGLRHARPAPVRGVWRRRVRRLRQHLELHFFRQRRLAGRARLVTPETVNAFLDVALLPAPYAGLRLARAPHDLVGAAPIGRRQHDLSARHHFRRRVAAANQNRQTSPARRAHVHADIISPHRPRLTDLRRLGNHLLGLEH